MSLSRRLTLIDAVSIGAGAMIGAGVFAVWTPAIAASGSGLLTALAIAATVALCNALASAQLAAQHPVSGGTYAYARAEIGPWSGFVAGWCFMIGKIASCAAMAMTFAAYAAPPGWERFVAIAAVVALVTVNCFGVTRTARLSRILVVLALLGIAIVVAAGATSAPDTLPLPLATPTPYGVLQAAGLLFFAFAGYARIATLGEEVRDPTRTIPRAIIITFVGVLGVYVFVAVTVMGVLGGTAATSTAPLVDVVHLAGWTVAIPLVRVAAAAASLGALLALITGLGRTGLAMARENDLPRQLAHVNERWQVPQRAEVAVGVIVVALVAAVDLRGAIGFSSFGVLLYYLLTNVSALRQSRPWHKYPRVLFLFGAAGCVALASSLPWQSVLGGIVVVALGLGIRMLRRPARTHQK